MNALGWLILGLLVGWAIEFAIDFFYWRKKARLEAEALVQQEAVLLAQQTELGHKQSALRLREKEVADLQASVATRDAELLQAAHRMEERSDDLGRLEQQTEKRRADLDRMSMTLSEREKDIATRQDQLRSKEADYGRRLNALEATEQELARRVAVVANREDAMQSWEGRILSREHDVTDREASVNYYAGRIASDAAAFDATKHLLKQYYRTSEGRDNLQALVGIDPKVADLLRDAGIRSFERLAETSLGELTRILEGAGPRFALANPLSWAEQAAHWLNEDYVALDRLQCELLGIEREPVGDQLFAQMTQAAVAKGAQKTEASETAASIDAEAATGEVAQAGTALPDAGGQARVNTVDGASPDEAVSSHSGEAGADAGSAQGVDEAARDAEVTSSGQLMAAQAEQADASDPSVRHEQSAADPSVMHEATAHTMDAEAGGAAQRDGQADAVGADERAVVPDAHHVMTEDLPQQSSGLSMEQGAKANSAGAPDSRAEVVQAASDEADALLSLVAEEAEEVAAAEGAAWQRRAQAVADAEDVTVTVPPSASADHGR
ncbi:MAG: hypothetical protein Q4D91_08710 [Lautropia sp.]|nr:hypothetical protein [Lautropia sp.]